LAANYDPDPYLFPFAQKIALAVGLCPAASISVRGLGFTNP